MLTSIQKWGNSQGIRIPKTILESVKFSEHEQVDISTEDGRIILTKANPRKTIVQLFEGYDGNYEPTEIDWGEPVGKEIW